MKQIKMIKISTHSPSSAKIIYKKNVKGSAILYYNARYITTINRSHTWEGDHFSEFIHQFYICDDQQQEHEQKKSKYYIMCKNIVCV